MISPPVCFLYQSDASSLTVDQYAMNRATTVMINSFVAAHPIMCGMISGIIVAVPNKLIAISLICFPFVCVCVFLDA